GIRRRRPRYPDGILAEPASDRARTRPQCRTAWGYSRAASDARFLDNKIVVIQTVNCGYVWGVGDTIAGDRLIAIRDDLQQSTRPYNRTVSKSDDFCEALLRFLLRIENRRQHQTESLAIRRIGTEIAKIGGRETGSVPRIGEEIGGDCSRVRIFSVGAAQR